MRLQAVWEVSQCVCFRKHPGCFCASVCAFMELAYRVAPPIRLEAEVNEMGRLYAGSITG